jgi:hypothetical protein
MLHVYASQAHKGELQIDAGEVPLPGLGVPLGNLSSG